MYYSSFFISCQLLSFGGYTDSAQLLAARLPWFWLVKRLWNKANKRSKIKVRSNNLTINLKEIASLYGHYTKELSKAQTTIR